MFAHLLDIPRLTSRSPFRLCQDGTEPILKGRFPVRGIGEPERKWLNSMSRQELSKMNLGRLVVLENKEPFYVVSHRIEVTCLHAASPLDYELLEGGDCVCLGLSNSPLSLLEGLRPATPPPQ